MIISAWCVFIGGINFHCRYDFGPKQDAQDDGYGYADLKNACVTNRQTTRTILTLFL
jgi:hypothetical protein